MRDDFERLMEAVMRLQDCIRDMGSSAEVAEIRLKPTRGGVGRFEVERALKASPSYARLCCFENERALPHGCVAEIAGVRLVDIPV